MLFGELQSTDECSITLNIRPKRRWGQEHQLSLVSTTPHLWKLRHYFQSCNDIDYMTALRDALSSGVHQDDTSGSLIWRHDTKNNTVNNSLCARWTPLHTVVTLILNSWNMMESLIEQTFKDVQCPPSSLWFNNEKARVTKLLNTWHVAPCLRLADCTQDELECPFAPLRKLEYMLGFLSTVEKIVQAGNQGPNPSMVDTCAPAPGPNEKCDEEICQLEKQIANGSSDPKPKGTSTFCALI